MTAIAANDLLMHEPRFVILDSNRIERVPTWAPIVRRQKESAEKEIESTR
jgi:hypothetical protein